MLQHYGTVPDALAALLRIAEDLLRSAPALRAICRRDLPSDDPRYPEQHRARIAQQREIPGLEQHPNDIVRIVLACHAVVLTIRTLLERCDDTAAVAQLAPSGTLQVEYPNVGTPPVTVTADVVAQTIAERAIVTPRDAALIWEALVVFLRDTCSDTALLGLYRFRAEDALLLARSPPAIDRALGKLDASPSDDDATHHS